jgi:hypothetical protein
LVAFVPLAFASWQVVERVRRDVTVRRAAVLGIHVRTYPASPAPASRFSLKELIAVRRLEAHDAAVRRNAAARAECEASNKERRSTFYSLYGLEPATPGPAFGGLRVGGEWVRPEEGLFPIHWEYDERGIYATVADGTEPRCYDNEDPEVFCPFRCAHDEAADCEALESRLREAWGWSDNAVWWDKTKRVRAVVRLQKHPHWSGPVDCELRFQESVPARAWIAMSDMTSIPLGLLGKPRSKLPKAAEPEYTSEYGAHAFKWVIPITGAHIMSAEISAIVRNSRIIRLVVAGELDVDGGADEIHELVRPFRDRGLYVKLETHGTEYELAIARARRDLEPRDDE